MDMGKKTLMFGKQGKRGDMSYLFGSRKKGPRLKKSVTPGAPRAGKKASEAWGGQNLMVSLKSAFLNRQRTRRKKALGGIRGRSCKGVSYSKWDRAFIT